MNKESLKSVAVPASRILSLGFLLVTSFAVGFGLGDELSQFAEAGAGWLKKGVPALGVGVFLTFLQNTVKVVPNFTAFVTGGSREKLWLPCAMFFAMGMTIVLALNLVENTVKPPPPKIVVWDAWAGGRAVSGESQAKAPAAKAAVQPVVFPVFFEEEGAAGENGSFSAGTTLAPEAEQLLTRLAAGVAECAEADVEDSVRLEVLGFASSSSYRGHAPDDPVSREFNLKVAQARAATVREVVERAVGVRRGVRVETRRWGSVEDMETERKMNDAALGQYSPRTGYLNRRAEIRLLQGGRCEVVQPGRS